MALDRYAAAVFEVLRSRHLCQGTLLMLGRQHLALHAAHLPQGVELPEDTLRDLESGADVYAEPFFQAMGFERIESIDYSPYEGCGLVHDLNQPIPEAWHQRADVVFDGGTLEHVFHFPNAIANAMNLVKEGGCFVTCTPYNGFPGHGFYQFSPELFFRLFQEESGFEVLLSALGETRPGGRLFRVEDPAVLRQRILFGGQGPTTLVFVAQRKEAKPVLPRPPQQSDYEAAWSAPRAIHPDQPGKGPRSPLRQVKAWARKGIPGPLLERYDHFRYRLKHWAAEMKGTCKVRTMRECWTSLI